MTQTMQRVIERLSRLPDTKQERVAARILKQLEAEEEEASWIADRQWIGGRKPTREEIIGAIDGMKELRKGITLGDDLTIRELINEGRR